MAHHKKRRPKNSRAGCLMCKMHKVNGACTADTKGRFNEQKKRRFMAEEIKEHTR